MERNLLIIEDDPGLQSQMRWCFDDDIKVYLASDRIEATAMLEQQPCAVVTLDLGLPPDAGGTSEGEAMLDFIRSNYPATKIIVVTGREEREQAIHAIAAGAYDYYQKPIDATTLEFAVARAFNLAELEHAHSKLSASNSGSMPLPGLIAAHSNMLTLAEQVRRVANSEITVLIQGETGTGKEIIARSLHELSERKDHPLITINCAAIPENLLESELFGHEKGSFTGAHTRKIGKVEAAYGGTLFLDEIGDMPLALQAKILRFLQERKFERVGSNTPIDADVRVISATHRNLTELIGAGDFREDLYYRVSEVDLTLPPLRERGTDVLLIAEKILRENQADRKLRFSPEALAAIETANWPGNVRELENKVRRAAIMSPSNVVSPEDLHLVPPAADRVEIRTLKEVRASAEHDAIVTTLATTAGNISETSRLLGISRPTLYSLMEKYRISPDNCEPTPT